MNESGRPAVRTGPWRHAALAVLLVLLSGCGFQLRGERALPFQTLAIQEGGNAELGALLKRSIRASSHTDVVDDPKQAQVTLVFLDTRREKVILSLNSAGRAREYQLVQHFRYQLVDAKGELLQMPQEITLHRDITFNDDVVLAKEQEEQLLYRDMQNDLVQQILRRLAAARLAPKS